MNQELQHLFLKCPYAANCWSKLLQIFNLSWVFCGSFSSNVLQILSRPNLKKTSLILWCNAVKALLLEIWFKRNQHVFHNTASVWSDRFEYARLNASAWDMMFGAKGVST